jgi:EF hand
MEESMKTTNALAAVLLIGTVVGPAALAQTTTKPNSGAAVPGMGGGMMGAGMMDRGHWHHHDIAGAMMIRMIFSLMDADGDGKLTLQEFQAAHERIFKAMDTDHDGTVTLEEMQAFIRGH